MCGYSVRHRQLGAGQLKVIIWLAILAGAVYVAVLVVPVLVNEYQFQDAMQTTARFATVNRQSPEDIRAAVVKQAKAEDIPILPEDIHVESDAGNVRIHADYSVTVDLHVYEWTLNFHPTATNNAL